MKVFNNVIGGEKNISQASINITETPTPFENLQGGMIITQDTFNYTDKIKLLINNNSEPFFLVEVTKTSEFEYEGIKHYLYQGSNYDESGNTLIFNFLFIDNRSIDNQTLIYYALGNFTS